MNTIIKDGRILKSECGEIINVRVYSDGWVKMNGYNMFENFETIEKAEQFVNEHKLTLA